MGKRRKVTQVKRKYGKRKLLAKEKERKRKKRKKGEKEKINRGHGEKKALIIIK